MKIAPLPATAPDVLEAAAAPLRKASTSGPPQQGATVALSPASSALAQSDGDIDMARVDAIREAIRSGELTIDASRIADGLIASARELIR